MGIDFYQIHSDLFDVIAAGPADGWDYDDVAIFFEMEARKQSIDSMPYIDVRQGDADIEERSIPTGEYALITYEIDIVTYHLNSFREAAIIRSSLVNVVQSLLKENRNFSDQLNTSRIVPTVSFQQGTIEGATIAGGIASATISLIAEAYIE